MTRLETGPDLQQLREEITRTRAALSEAVEALAAEASAKFGAGPAVDRAEQQIRTAGQRLHAHALGAAEPLLTADWIRAFTREPVQDDDPPSRLRAALPLAAVGLAAVGGLVALVLRQRS
ncbi:hypothetical protein ACGFI9_30495 [Micromonospora sp. NPDC048930]|uniref:hypothetical protein n=1 Tax=Micromonospora sp. NPDC048930 TaxID=3364261 RepID=UPI003721B522